MTPQDLCHHVNDIILPALEIQVTISELTACRWLKIKLGYKCKEAKKGIYIDGHKRPDVIKEREAFIKQIDEYELYVTYNFCHMIMLIWPDYRMMATYHDGTLDCIPPTLAPGEKEHVVVFQDKSIFHANEYCQQSWMAENQQAIWKKGHGRAVHVSDFISETIGRIALSEDQIAEQMTWLANLRLPAFEARKIIYPRKGFDMWWDLTQLIKQVELTIKVFEYTHPDCVAIFVFDWSSAHEGFAENALNVNNMNIHHGARQRKLHDTVIPLNNPPPAQGEEDMRGHVQRMYFPDDHPKPELRGKPKGIKVILQERKSIWDKYT